MSNVIHLLSERISVFFPVMLINLIQKYAKEYIQKYSATKYIAQKCLST